MGKMVAHGSIFLPNIDSFQNRKSTFLNTQLTLPSTPQSPTVKTFLFTIDLGPFEFTISKHTI
jgi:hypothetical protein